MSTTSTTAAATAHCTQCDRQVRVSEPFAFFGRDRARATLACGHIADEIPKSTITVREAIAANIRRIRGLRGLKGQELVSRLAELGFALTPSGLSEVETGKRRVGAEELLVFAIALNTSVIDLLTPADNELLNIADGVEPIGPPWLELWLQGEAPLYHRQPVEDQGDADALARLVRAEMQERAAQRWLALAARVRQMERAEYQRSEQQKAAGR